MCGIAGVWSQFQAEGAQRSVQAMLRRMRSRGPDGARTLPFECGALGMVRLALVDVSRNGMQPLLGHDGMVAIVFNGEMYNYGAERERLITKGYTFHSRSDTEVVLALYLELGDRF